MAEEHKVKRTIIDAENLPHNWPTHRHTAEFWTQLGRTVATYGLLEEVLGKAILAYTGTTQCSPEEVEAKYVEWLPTLESALTDTLKSLADAYAKAVCENAENTTENIDELIKTIKEASEIRNVICHGSWQMPDAEGRSVPLFVNKKKEIFETPIDTEFLHQIQVHVAEIACAVMSTVTHMGYQFPGGAGPGKPIWISK